MTATLPTHEPLVHTDTVGRRGGRHRVVGIAALAAGMLLVVAPLAGNGFGRAMAGERLITQARPAVGREGIVQLRADTDLVIGVGGAILNDAIPVLGEALGLSEAETRALVTERFPNLAEADARKVELGTALDATVTNLEAHTDEFGEADSIPFAGVHPVVLPTAALLTGIVLAACGVALLRTPSASRRRSVLLAVGIVGGLMAVLPVGLRLPQKAAAAESLLASLTTTEENAARTREQFDLTTAAAAEIRDGLLPEAAAALGATPDQLLVALQREVPDVAGLDDLDPALARIEADVRFREERLDDFALVKPLPMAAVSWAFVACGAALAVAALASARRSRPRV